MAKKTDNDAVAEFLAEFFKDEEIDEYVIGEAANVLGRLGFEAKVDMIAAGAVLMMKRLADRHGVHILDCMCAVPKWVSLLVANDIWNDVRKTRRENEHDGQTETETENQSEPQSP